MIDAEKTATEAILSSDDLRELWQTTQPSREPSPDPVHDAERLCHEFFAELGHDSTDGISWMRESLIRLREFAAAERIFFFDVNGFASSAGVDEDSESDSPSSEVGQCLIALDFDDEPISKPEGRIPTELFDKVVDSATPIFLLDANEAQDGGGDASLAQAVSKVRGFGVVPLVVHDVCHAVVYFEHRFQPLEVPHQNFERLFVTTHTLATRYAIQKLTRENRSLWIDLLAQRQTLKDIEQSSAPIAVSKLRSKSKSKRANLKGNYDLIIGSSEPMQAIFELLDRIRTSNAPVLINGESGTGKELIATAIHHNSPRKEKDFVSENCGALTETLLESELFGYVKGAFTGANRDHKGLFELADGGTLFLDEVGDMSPAMQKKLLRAIQEGIVRPVGGKEYISVDVRIISATNKDLHQEVRLGNFREDLFYRLNVINLKLPPLRERRDDIPELVHHFLGELEKETGLSKVISAGAIQLLLKHPWPGNIRELQNEVKRLVALSDGEIDIDHLSEVIRRGEGLDLISTSLEEELRCMTLKEALEKVEKALIKRALVNSQGNKSKVAKQLQIPKTSLYNKISKYGLDSDSRDGA